MQIQEESKYMLNSQMWNEISKGNLSGKQCIALPSAAAYSALVGSTVTLHCLSAKLPSPLNLTSLTVEWIKEEADGKPKAVYSFEHGFSQPHRKGADVDRTGMLHRNVSLKIVNISVWDAGPYTCRVITPVVDSCTAHLEVKARPVVRLDNKASIAHGEEKLIVCDVRDYFPRKLAISWFLQNDSHAVPSRVSHPYRVCTEMDIPNADGTYSIRSGITAQSSMLESGPIQLICQVEHKTFQPGSFNMSVTLTQALPGQHMTLMAGISVSSVLVLLAVGAVLLSLRYSRRKAIWNAPPNISEICQPSVTYANVEDVLKCMISGVGAGEFQVQWYQLTGMGDSGTGDSGDAEVALLLWEDVTGSSRLKSDGSHHTSVLSLRLSTEQDGSSYRCVVQWNGQTFTRETTVRVRVQPSFLQVSSIPQIPKVQRLLVLCCRVENFYPSNINLEWFRNDGEPVPPATYYGPFSDHSHLYSVWSKIQLTMATEDESAVYTCRVYHSSFGPPGYKDALYHINTHGTPPNVMFIDCESQSPEENTLHLCIKDFCPKHITVTWTMDGEPVDGSSVFNTPPSLNINGLYSMYSFLKLSSKGEQRNCRFRCRVEHSAQIQPEERCYALTWPAPESSG
uniref:Ig-like domain-containing protein n=1 Tax=Knipowitschia caucasica TaxID=637954 RepID=A0AAV2M686_KNICA